MTRKLLKPWNVTLIVGLMYVSWILYLGAGDPLTFAEIGTRYSEGDPTGTEGYDGQFFYYIAVDPAGAVSKIDAPAYRFQRILYPLLVRWLSLGNEALMPWLFLALNLAGMVGGVWVTEQLLIGQHVNRWHALPVGLYAGQLLSIRVNLPEPLALGLTLLGIWLFERWQRRDKQGQLWLLSVLCFTLALFTKETMVVTGLAYVIFLLIQRDVRKSLAFGAILIIPFAIFQLYLYRWLGSFGPGSGGAGATPFEIIPLGGLLRIGQSGWDLVGLFLLILGPIVILPAGWAIYAAGKDIFQRHWHPWTMALFLNSLIILFLPHSTFREPLAMLRFTGPLVALVILYSALTKRWRALNYSYLWLATLVFLINDPLIQ